MKKIILSVFLAVSFLGVQPQKAEAGVIISVNGTVASIAALASGNPAGILALGITAVVGGSLIWGGATLVENNPSGSPANIIGIVLLVLENKSIDEFERFVEVRYPFIENVDAKAVLAQTLKEAYEANEQAEMSELHIEADKVEELSSAFGLSDSQRMVLIQDLSM